MSIGGLVTLWAAFIIYTAGAASAQPYYREVITDINQLTTQAGSTGQYVTVTCYYSTSTLCAGGGDFDQVGTSCSPNGATIFQNIHTNQCFFRKNFGVNGVADARQCGIHGDGATDDTTLLNNCMTIAASLQVPVVNTGGGRVLAISDNVSIPATVELTCSGPPGGQRPQKTKGAGAVPYSTLPSTIIIHPPFTILRSANSRYRHCIEIPDWYAAALGNVTDIASLITEIEHKFTGTGTKCGDIDPADGSPTTDGEACDMEDVMILGFDICDDTANAARAVLRDLKLECNVGEALHANGGGLQLQGVDVHNFIEAHMDVDNGTPAGLDISKAQWPIQSMAAVGSGNDEVRVTLYGDANGELANGDTILIGGLTFGNTPLGQSGRWLIENFSCSTDCVFDLILSSWTGPTYSGATWKQGSNVVTVYDTTQIAGGQYLCASGTPPFSCTVPTAFAASATAISTGSNTLTASRTNLPRLTVGSTANWPQSGLVCVYPNSSSCSGHEYLGYTLQDATHIQITLRGADGTTVAAHGVSDILTPSPPMVIASVPAVHRIVTTSAGKTNATMVVVNATAQTSVSDTGTSVSFLNDPYFPTSASAVPCNSNDSSSSTPNPCGYVILNANYRTWTADPDAGSTPDGMLTVGLSSHTSNTLALASPFALKVQEGMTIIDVTKNNLSLGYVDQTPVATAPTAVHYHGSSITPADGDQLQFSGCGYPGLKDSGISPPEPWLGNCAATAFLFYGLSATYGAVGTGCDTLHSHGWRVYLHMNNGQETACSKMIFDSGSNGNLDDNDTADPSSVGLWIEGDGDKIELGQGKVEARNAFINTGDPANDNVTLTNFNLRTSNDNSVVFANSATTTFGEVHGGADGAGYADSTETALTITGTMLPDTTISYDDPTKLAALHCANNTFANTFCSNLLHPVDSGGVPKIISGGGTSPSLAGTDTAGRITTDPGSSAGSSIVVNFATAWAASPVCFVQDESTAARNPIAVTSISTTSMTFQSKGSNNFGSGDNISYQCAGFH